MNNTTKLSIFCGLLLCAACGVDDPEQGDLEVAGTWASNFGFDEQISNAMWGVASVQHYDNSENFAITQQPADDMFNPSKFAKIVWTEPTNGRFHYCTVDFGLDTMEAAMNTTKTADSSDPDNGGCAMFSWTRLQPLLEIAGVWTSMFGPEEITSHMWGVAKVSEYDNDTNVAITQQPDDDMFNPSKYNKVVWTDVEGGSFYYCTVDFGRDTLEEAKTSTQTADDANPDASGCGMFPWTKLSP